ncbi:MAG: hypothetical protein ABSB75_06775, partial [Candidatus Limnocylindrales bacterium]
FGPEGALEMGAKLIPLDAALDLAVKHSRLYQNNKERLYLRALALTLARHQYTPLFKGNVQSEYQVNTEQIQVGIDALTGLPKALYGQGSLVAQDQVTGKGSLSADVLLRSGARISAAFTTDFLRYLAGDPRTVTSSRLGATLVQPLWRGAGYKATMENLTQAERSLLYQLRAFTQYRKDFSVQIASAYYGVVQGRDAVRNSYRGLLSSRKYTERARALAQEGRTTQAELGRLAQQELATVPGLYVYPTGSNFVLFRIEGGMTAADLQARLLTEHLMYVRDCSNKVGIDDRHVRVASQGREADARLVEALREVLS